jgi:hypothetical protein
MDLLSVVRAGNFSFHRLSGGCGALLVTRKMDLDAALREGWKSVAAPPRMQSRLNILMATEIALSFVLLFGAGLFISSHSRLKQVASGSDPHDVLTVRITAGGAERSSPIAQRAYYREVMRRAASTGGIRQVALASDTPLAGGDWILYSETGHPHRREAKSEIRSFV